jgi:uncharacterized protein YukE
MTMTSNSNSPVEMLARAQEYQQCVLEYERLDQEIDALLSAHGGASRNLSSQEFAQYRQLVTQRDLAYNTMKTLEQTLLDE